MIILKPVIITNNTFSKFHGGYISDDRVMGFRTYTLLDSEDYYQNT